MLEGAGLGYRVGHFCAPCPEISGGTQHSVLGNVYLAVLILKDEFSRGLGNTFWPAFVHPSVGGLMRMSSVKQETP